MYEKWLQDFSSMCQEKLGMSIEDLPDLPIRDWYEEGWGIDEAFEVLMVCI